MLARSLILVIGFLALPGQSLATRRPTRVPVDTIADCASWVVAQPSDDCELLANRSQAPLEQLLSYVGFAPSAPSRNGKTKLQCLEPRLATNLQDHPGFFLLLPEERRTR